MAGLTTTGGDPIPLIGVDVSAAVTDLSSCVTIRQTYRNTGEQPIEAVYLFPMPDLASVNAFVAEVDGRRIVGSVKEKEEAKQEYDEAIARGDGAFMLEEEEKDVFRASVGNVLPGSEVVIEIAYVAPLATELGAARFALPTTIAPRYHPAPANANAAPKPASATVPYARKDDPLEYDLGFTMTISSSLPLDTIVSPTHGIECDVATDYGMLAAGSASTKREAKRRKQKAREEPRHVARVDLSEREPLDADLVILITYVDPYQPSSVVEIVPSPSGAAASGAVMVALYPELEAEAVRSEIVFLVDCSGSMRGQRMEAVKATLAEFLSVLPATTRFNIVCFGSDFEMYKDASVPSIKKNLRAAKRYVAGMDANLGGTAILNPLQAIFATEPADGFSRQVFVLTDGQVSNTDQVISTVWANSDSTRLFAFGIGASVSRHLVNGIARAGGGAAEYVNPSAAGEDAAGGGDRQSMHAKVMAQLRRALQPALTRVSVDWGGLDVVQAPAKLRPVFDGQRMIVYGLAEDAESAFPTIDDGTVVEHEIAITAVLPSGDEVRYPAVITFGQPRVGGVDEAPSGQVHALAVREIIRDLEEGMSPRTGGGDNALSTEALKAEIVRLSVGYQVSSKHTAFLAVEEREEAGADGAMVRRDVPSNIPRDKKKKKAKMMKTKPRGTAGTSRGSGSLALVASPSLSINAGLNGKLRPLRVSRVLSEVLSYPVVTPFGLLATPRSLSKAPPMQETGNGTLVPSNDYAEWITHVIRAPVNHGEDCWLHAAVTALLAIEPVRNWLLATDVAAVGSNNGTRASFVAGAIVSALARLVQHWVLANGSDQAYADALDDAYFDLRVVLADRTDAFPPNVAQCVLDVVDFLLGAIRAVAGRDLVSVASAAEADEAATGRYPKEPAARLTRNGVDRAQFVVFANSGYGPWPDLTKSPMDGYEVAALVTFETMDVVGGHEINHYVCMAPTDHGVVVCDSVLNVHGDTAVSEWNGYQGGLVPTDIATQTGCLRAMLDSVPLLILRKSAGGTANGAAQEVVTVAGTAGSKRRSGDSDGDGAGLRSTKRKCYRDGD